MISLNCCYIELLCLLMFPRSMWQKQINYYLSLPSPSPVKPRVLLPSSKVIIDINNQHFLSQRGGARLWCAEKQTFFLLANAVLCGTQPGLFLVQNQSREEMEMFFVVIVQLRSLVLHKAMVCTKKRSIAKQFSCFSM